MRQSNKFSWFRSVLSLGLLISSGLHPAHADRLWWDGTRDTTNEPPGKLLSDNAGYWGERVTTDVEYSYEAAPDNPPDAQGDDTKVFGRRLLDGVPSGDWHTPVGVVNRPLIVTFDFKQPCLFSEVDLCTRSGKAAVTVEAGDSAQGPWRLAFQRDFASSPDTALRRLPLPERPSGRYLRISFNAVAPQNGNYLTYLEEVLVWGDVQDKGPEKVHAVAPIPVIEEGAFPSIPGSARTAVSQAEFVKWQRDLGAKSRQPAVWSQVPTWDAITDRPILPAANMAGQAVSLKATRNETENAALALTNTSMTAPMGGVVTLSAFRPVGAGSVAASRTVRASLRVGGAIQSRFHGPVIGPLLTSDNMPGANLLRRYLTNTDDIHRFPNLTLSPAGSVVLWLSVSTDGTPPGLYEASLTFKAAEDSDRAGSPVTAASALKVRVQVVDVTLPRPPVWLQTWSGTTSMFPFIYADRAQQEVEYKQSLGVTVWNGLPTPGSAAELAQKSGDAIYQVNILPHHYINEGYNNRLNLENLGPDDEKAIAEHVHALVKQTQALGLGYNDWYGELWDEPGRGNITAFGALAGLIKKIDPRVHLYANPIFWEGSGNAPDDVVAPLLSPWYRQAVDISVPHEQLLRGYPRSTPLFDAPRFIRASYRVSTHGDKNESATQLDSYRRQAWDAFTRGYNGWGFYSYYAPVGDPWNDFDGAQPDYQMVYPGPRGPIASRTSENVREGWEDYRLLTLLKQRGLAQEVAALLRSYAAGEPPQVLRLRALEFAARRPGAN
jgi:hypothetical protein